MLVVVAEWYILRSMRRRSRAVVLGVSAIAALSFWTRSHCECLWWSRDRRGLKCGLVRDEHARKLVKGDELGAAGGRRRVAQSLSWTAISTHDAAKR